MNITLLKRVRILVDENLIDEAEKIILDHLSATPKDSEAWICLALVKMTPPYEDHRLIFEWMDKLLAYDPFNANALLMLSYVHFSLVGDMPDDLYHRLCRVNDTSTEIMSMIELAKSWYFDYKNDWINYEKTLRKSIQYCSSHQDNLTNLGAFLIERGNLQEGLNLLNQGFRNIKHYCTSNDTCDFDPISMDRFLDEHFKGTSISEPNYERLKIFLERKMLLFNKENSLRVSIK